MIPAMEANEATMRQAALAASQPQPIWRTIWCAVAFRDAHEAGKAVAHCVTAGCDSRSCRWQRCSPFMGDKEDVFEALTLDGSVAARNHFGGTAPNRVKAAVQAAQALLAAR